MRNRPLQIKCFVESAKWRCQFALLLLCLVSPGLAQLDLSSPWFERTSVGLRTGLNFPGMSYSDPDRNSYESSIMVGGALGVYGDIALGSSLSIRPELLYIGKGQTIDDHGVHYEFRSHYLDWRFPVAYHLQKIQELMPYVLAGPVIGMATGGTIELDDGTAEWETDISNASISSWEFGLMMGAGVKKNVQIARYPVVAGAEISYGLGLTDTYSEKENNETSYGLNDAYYSISGTRKNYGVLVSLSVEIPLSLFKKVEPEPAPIAEVPEPVYVEATPDTLPKDTVTHCYTIEEIDALIDMNENVNNKVICMNNLNFEFNKSSLDNMSESYLSKIVKLLEKVPSMKMKISGHADNIGTDERNRELSRARASAVYDCLLNQGISANRITFEYFGSTRPLVDNDSEEHRAMNRRVEFEILAQSQNNGTTPSMGN